MVLLLKYVLVKLAAVPFPEVCCVVYRYSLTSRQFLLVGPQELKVLVDLAMISGGETDMDTARITCLHSSCLGFAPLIFKLEPACGFKELMDACQPVWDAIKSDPNLHIKLV